MTKYVIKRILLAFISLFIILSLTFLLMKTLPIEIPQGTTADVKLAFLVKQTNNGYMIELNSGSDFGGLTFDEVYQQYINLYGNPISSVRLLNSSDTHYFFNRPILDQYGAWLSSIFTKWDWGTSYAVDVNRDCMDIILAGLPYTIKVNVISVVISVPLGILLGVVAALNKNKATDNIISTIVMILISVPSFVLITFMIMIFGYNLKVLPTEWPKSFYPTGQKALGYIIPVVALSLGAICGYCRFTRAELCDVLSSDYLLLARTKGLTKRQAVIRHALRNAMVPILPSILAEIIGVLSGSMILESLYNIPGIGTIFINALNYRDYNLLMVDMAIFTMIGLLASIVLDLSYGFLDPRIRVGEKK